MQENDQHQGAQAPAENAGPAPAQDQIAALAEELNRLKDERLRERAEIDNQRKRLHRDLEQTRRFANERLLSDLLPILDSLEAGLATAGADAGKLREGLELTLRLLRKVLADHGVETLDPQGQAFDPERHHAMSMVEVADQPEGSVVQVFQKGYLLNQRLLRPALVVVAKAAE